MRGHIDAVASHAYTLGRALETWGKRDDDTPGSSLRARRAANTAVDAIDSMHKDLYALRARLLAEMRQHDDAAMVRTDKLLADTHRETSHD